jgi:thiamine biosynthesis lipoprotein
VRGDEVPAAVLDAALAHLHDVDARFSTYRDDSEVSRLARGSISVDDCSADVGAVLALADAVRLKTGGFFDVIRRNPDGSVVFDPSGIVKGWAVDGAADLLARGGLRSFSINAGGDVVTRSTRDLGQWRVGLRHPFESRRVFAVIEATDLCVATSGTYERGSHIVDPHTALPPAGLASMTVVGARLAIVDAYATAAFAMGPEGVSWVGRQPGYGVCAVTTAGRVRFDDEFARLRVN